MANEIEEQRIRKGIQLLCSAFRTRMDKDGLEFWVSKLADYAGPQLWSALKSALDGDRMPTLRDLRQASGAASRPNAYKEPPPLTADQRKRSDHAAIMSMLWLHYDKGWPLTDFGGHILGRLFGKDPHEALAKAKEIYDAPTVKSWMSDQARAGN
jgi:hypothetical protein